MKNNHECNIVTAGTKVAQKGSTEHLPTRLYQTINNSHRENLLLVGRQSMSLRREKHRGALNNV